MRDGACCVRVDVSGQGEPFPPDGRFTATDEGHTGVTSDTRHCRSAHHRGSCGNVCVFLSSFSRVHVCVVAFVLTVLMK